MALPLPDSLDPANIPQHVAVIMDGNGRWAQRLGEERLHGHRNAIEAVRAVVEGSAELGIRYLTLYTFSTENWQRPKEEVDGLMQLLVHTLRAEIDTLLKNDIRLATIGDTSGLPDACRNELAEAIALSSRNAHMTLTLALNYSGRWELTEAARRLAHKAKSGELDPDRITEADVAGALQTVGMPDPELLIRTSGEMRLSNYLLWQLAYTELYVTDTLWPDFDKETLIEAVAAYQKRDRRFGRVLA